MTGSGKSTFVQQFTTCNITIGNRLESCETCSQFKHSTNTRSTYTIYVGTDIVLIPCSLSDGTTFYLMDTPGFDDTLRSDGDVLHDISNFLDQSIPGTSKKTLAGIIYIHSLLDTRFLGSVLRNLRIFKKLCGGDDFARIVLATTMWDMIDQETAERKENEIKTNSDFWGLMIKRGSSIFRLDRGEESAAKVIEYLLSCREK
jgi:hypothetical protein